MTENMKTWYQNLENRYSTFPEETQVLNMISDLNKARNLTGENTRISKNHLIRALILLDYIIADSKWQSKLCEVLRFREVLCSLIDGNAPMGTIDQVIQTAKLLTPGAYKAFLST